MKRFVRDNSNAIVKFVLTHIVMSVLGLMVGLAILAMESNSDGLSLIALIGSAFTIGYMCFIHYDDMYFIAVKEGIRIRSEGGNVDALKGLKISLVAYTPVLFVGAVTIVMNIIGGENGSAISLLIYHAFQGSFTPLYSLLQYVGVIGYVLITLIPAVLSSSLGYAIGVNDKTLRGLLGMDVKPPFDGPLERKPKDKE